VAERGTQPRDVLETELDPERFEREETVEQTLRTLARRAYVGAGFSRHAGPDPYPRGT
jgi:hypothetical protein